MKMSKHQKSIDEIIGEAALTLLQRSGPVNTHALMAELQNMQMQATDEEYCTAISMALKEVRTSISLGQQQRNEPEKDNVHPLFGNDQSSGNSRKH